MYECIYVYMCVGDFWRPEEDVGFPEMGVTEYCELPMDSELWTLVFWSIS